MRRLLLAAVILLTACTPEQVTGWFLDHGTVLTGGQAEAISLYVADQARIMQERHNNPFLRCVRRHESDTSGGYKAQNRKSSASGAYQFLDGTWRTESREAGITNYARAIQAPPHVQDWVAYHAGVIQRQRSHWKGSGC